MGDMSITARVYVAGNERDMCDNLTLSFFYLILAILIQILMTATMKVAWAM